MIKKINSSIKDGGKCPFKITLKTKTSTSNIYSNDYFSTKLNRATQGPVTRSKASVLSKKSTKNSLTRSDSSSSETSKRDLKLISFENTPTKSSRNS